MTLAWGRRTRDIMSGGEFETSRREHRETERERHARRTKQQIPKSVFALAPPSTVRDLEVILQGRVLGIVDGTGDVVMSDKAMWLRFFRDAGILSGFDTKYALVFDENRMKMDMLGDLNKECLRDMGICAMGDMIAILKHAKHVVEESKTQAYEIPKPTSTSPAMKAPVKPVAASSSSSSVVVPPKSVVVSTKANSGGGTGTVKAPTVTKKVLVKRVVQRSAISSVKIKQDCDSTAEVRMVKKPTMVVRLKGSPERLEVPLQKKTRVLPEQEGSYKVIMPQGKTPKTQALLQSRLGPPGKTSVFDRLSRVSSSSESSQESSSKSSVFSRLGKGSEEPAVASTAQGKKVNAPRSGFDLSTQFVVKQATTNSRQSSLGTGSERATQSRLNRVSSPITATVISKPANTSAAASKLSMDGGDSVSVKSRLGVRKIINRSRSRSRSRSPVPRRNRSISPPPRRIVGASRIAPPRRSSRSRSPLSPKRGSGTRPTLSGGKLSAERSAIVRKYSQIRGSLR